VREPYLYTEDRLEAIRVTNETDAHRNVWITDNLETGPGPYLWRAGYYGRPSPATEPGDSLQYLQGIIDRLAHQALDRLDERFDNLPPIL
jgi:hypothetical protein